MSFSIVFAVHFLYPLSSDSQKVANPLLLHFPRLLWCKEHPLLGKNVEVFLLETSMKKFTFCPELPERITQFLASPSRYCSASGMSGQGSGRHPLHPGACTRAGSKIRSWGCLGRTSSGVCNALSLTVFGLLSVRAFIVPILLPL